jgi:hypothetical protein
VHYTRSVGDAGDCDAQVRTALLTVSVFTRVGFVAGPCLSGRFSRGMATLTPDLVELSINEEAVLLGEARSEVKRKSKRGTAGGAKTACQ